MGSAGLELAINNLCLQPVQGFTGGLGPQVVDRRLDGVRRSIKHCRGSHGVRDTAADA